MGKGQTSKNLLLPQQVGERPEEGTRGEGALAVTSIPIPRCSPGIAQAALRAPPASPGTECPLLWLQLSSLPLSSCGLLAARLCSEKLIGGVNSLKTLRLGTLFGGVVPASAIVQQFKQEQFFKPSTEISGGLIQTGTSQHRAVLWLQAPCLSVGARMWLLPELRELELWSAPFGQCCQRGGTILPSLHQLQFSSGCLPAGSGPPEGHCWPAITSLPHCELLSLDALVSSAGSAQPSIPNGWQVPLGWESVWDSLAPETCCYQAFKCRLHMIRGLLICSLQTSGRGRCCRTQWLSG